MEPANGGTEITSLKTKSRLVTPEVVVYRKYDLEVLRRWTAMKTSQDVLSGLHDVLEKTRHLVETSNSRFTQRRMPERVMAAKSNDV